MASTQLEAYTSVGPVLMGGCAQIALWGVLCSTFSDFYTTSTWRNSTLLLRGTIWTVFGLTCTATALSVHDIWYYGTLVSNDLATILNGTGPQTIEPLLTGLTSAVAQIALALRGGRVIKDAKWRALYFMVTGSSILLAFTGATLVTAWSIEYHFFYTESSVNFLKISFTSCLAWWMWCDAASSCAITAVYLVVLLRQRADTTDTARSVIAKVIKITLQSAGFPTILAILAAITNQIVLKQNNSNLITYAFWEPLTTLYAISLFTTLSTGDKINKKMGHQKDIEAIQAQWSEQFETRKGSASTDATGVQHGQSINFEQHKT